MNKVMTYINSTNALACLDTNQTLSAITIDNIAAALPFGARIDDLENRTIALENNVSTITDETKELDNRLTTLENKPENITIGYYHSNSSDPVSLDNGNIVIQKNGSSLNITNNYSTSIFGINTPLGTIASNTTGSISSTNRTGAQLIGSNITIDLIYVGDNDVIFKYTINK